MSAQSMAWWRARQPRERLLLQILAWLIVALIPLAALQTAHTYRSQMSAELAAAQALQRDVSGLIAAPGGQAQAWPAAAASGLSSLVQAGAQHYGLTLQTVEAMGEAQVQVVAAPADSERLYQFLRALLRRGVTATHVAMTRVGDGDTVAGVFVFTRGV